ncbi:hypothetical protein C0J52_12801 [Blattella germanica]|nr:hypothetical protein C0J52_12801 [Blattella germanica]
MYFSTWFFYHVLLQQLSVFVVCFLHCVVYKFPYMSIVPRSVYRDSCPVGLLYLHDVVHLVFRPCVAALLLCSCGLLFSLVHQFAYIDFVIKNIWSPDDNDLQTVVIDTGILSLLKGAQVVESEKGFEESF